MGAEKCADHGGLRLRHLSGAGTAPFLRAGGSQPSGLSAQHASAAYPGALRAQPEKALAVYFGADGLSLLPDAPLGCANGTDTFQQFTEVVFAEKRFALLQPVVIQRKPFEHIFF